MCVILVGLGLALASTRLHVVWHCQRVERVPMIIQLNGSVVLCALSVALLLLRFFSLGLGPILCSLLGGWGVGHLGLGSCSVA